MFAIWHSTTTEVFEAQTNTLWLMLGISFPIWLDMIPKNHFKTEKMKLIEDRFFTSKNVMFIIVMCLKTAESAAM